MKHKLILFDGICNLCHGFVRYIIKRDKDKRFKFVALQSEAGKRLATKFDVHVEKELWSIILIDAGRPHYRSTAVLKSMRYLSGFSKLYYSLIIVPRFIRNGIYRFIGNHRYQWFGKMPTCPTPSSELKEWFDLSDLEL